MSDFMIRMGTLLRSGLRCRKCSEDNNKGEIYYSNYCCNCSTCCGGFFIYERTPVSFYSDENEISVSIIGGADGPTSVFIAGKLGGEDTMTYKQISMDEAKQIFESDADGSYIILDVRRADEFARGHIPGAINVANESIGAEAPAELTDKNQLIYVYCRSGNRSKQATEKLAALGYTNIVEFGGIIDWTGEIEK